MVKALEGVRLTERDPTEVFDILELIGTGNYGSVVKARYKETDQLVAIKQFSSDEALDLDSAAREVRVLQDCQHPNIIGYYEAFRHQSELWLVMEYCDGGSIDLVRKMLRENISESCLAYVAHEVLQGLQYLHAHHKIHRDIKPGNILINSKGEVKLCDFGITAELQHTLSRRNSYWGTMLYMAPEILNGTDYDERADLWSLGMTLLELAEGKLPITRLPPFPLVKYLTTQPPLTLQRKENFSPQFSVFIRRLLTKEKYARPSAAMMLEDSFLQHKDFPQRHEELGLKAKVVFERRRLLCEGAVDIAEDGSDDSGSEQATFVQVRSAKHGEKEWSSTAGGGAQLAGPGARSEGDAGYRSARGGSRFTRQDREKEVASQLLPLPSLLTQDFSFDALMYAEENDDSIATPDLLSLMTGRPPIGGEHEGEDGSGGEEQGKGKWGREGRFPRSHSPSTAPSKRTSRERRGRSSAVASEGTNHGLRHTIPGFEDEPPQTISHAVHTLQLLYLYYTQIPSMRALSQKEANDVMKAQAKLEDALACLYHLRALKHETNPPYAPL